MKIHVHMHPRNELVQRREHAEAPITFAMNFLDGKSITLIPKDCTFFKTHTFLENPKENCLKSKTSYGNHW